MIADASVEDLSRFRHAVHHKARPGQPGAGRKRHGKNGENVEIAVPVGTRITRDDVVIASLDTPGERAEVARGGEGGVGNFAFRSSTHQAPREAIPGAPGDETWLTMELRINVDVAMVGLPNSGKSAVFHALTGGAAVIAPYPRSTREPAFGPVQDEFANLYLVVDLPGVDEVGAPRPDGKLEQIERARVIIHCVDARGDDVAERLAAVRHTVDAYRQEGANEIVVGTHISGSDRPAGVDIVVDPDSGSGIDELRREVLRHLAAT